MKIRRIFAVQKHATAADMALLVLRVVAGAAFMHHGWGKIQSPLDWMGPGAPVPGFFQFLAALSEFGGGLAWILGLLTPLASFGILCTMTVAVYTHAVVLNDPFVPSGPGQGAWELAALYWSLALFLIANGPGRFSLDRPLFGAK